MYLKRGEARVVGITSCVFFSLKSVTVEKKEGEKDGSSQGLAFVFRLYLPLLYGEKLQRHIKGMQEQIADSLKVPEFGL